MRDYVFKLHGVGAGRCPFEAHDVGNSGEPLDHAEGQVLAGPERVVDDDSKLGFGLRRGADVFLEITLRMREVEGAGHLNEACAQPACGLRKALQFQRAGGLGTHGDRDPAGDFADHDLGNLAALIETHGREIARRASGEEGRVVGVEAGVDEEPQIGPQGRLVDRHALGVGKRCGNRDVTSLQQFLEMIGRHVVSLLRAHKFPASRATMARPVHRSGADLWINGRRTSSVTKGLHPARRRY